LKLCREVAPSDSITARPARMLHVSIALCGTPRRLRYSMEEALRRAQGAFYFPAFDVVLDSTACFGNDGIALVAVADTHTTDRVHDLRRALADAQQPFGLIGERSATVPHLTLGYGKRLLDRRQAVPGTPGIGVWHVGRLVQERKDESGSLTTVGSEPDPVLFAAPDPPRRVRCRKGSHHFRRIMRVAAAFPHWSSA
jgi:2'-5' RNA ligase